MPELHLRQHFRAFALLPFALLITGCVQVQFDSVFERNGTAKHTLSVTFPRDLFDAAEAAGETDQYDEVSSRAADAGLQASRIITTDTVTLRISTERPDGEDAGAALNSLLNATGINQSPGISAPFSGSFRQEGAAVGGNVFVLDMTIDGELLYDAVASIDAAEGESRNRIETDVTIDYQVNVPGDLKNSTGQEVEPGILRWDVAPGQTIMTQTEASAGDPERAMLFIISAVALTIVVILVGVFVGWALMRRSRFAMSIASAASHFPHRTTITWEGLWVAGMIRQVVMRIWKREMPGPVSPLTTEELHSHTEGGENGVDTEGDRPTADIHGGGVGT